MGPFPPFFPLTQTFFGLTSNYKIPLLEEIYICTQHLKGMSYSDVLAMPTYERRFFINQKTKEYEEQKERTEKVKDNSKGTRTTRVSGEALKNKMKSGDIPLNK